MLSPDFKREITRGVEKIIWEMQDELIIVLIMALTEHKEFSQQTVLKTLSAQKTGAWYKKITPVIAKATKKSKRAIKDAFAMAQREQARYDRKVYGRRIIFTAAMLAIIQETYEMTMQEVQRCLKETAQAACKSYYTALDKAYHQTTAKLQPWTRAFTRAVDDIGSEIKIAYDDVYQTLPEIAVARALRVGVSQMDSQITSTRAAENDVHLFLTSAHDGARPTHEPWQGQVFWVDWEELAGRIGIHLPDEVPEATEEEKAQYAEFCETTEIGEVQGLEGVNCRHSYGPFLAGEKNPYEGTKFDQSKYEKEQKARAMERNIRTWKHKYTAQKAAVDNLPDGELKTDEMAKMNATRQKLHDKTRAYYDYCETNGIKTPQEFRLYIAGK